MHDRIDKAERLYNSVLMLNRVAERTDIATKGNQKLSEAVETIRDCGYELTKTLAERDSHDDRRMDTIWSALDAAREAASSTDLDPRDHVFRNGLVFGLGEVADSLQALLDDRA